MDLLVAKTKLVGSRTVAAAEAKIKAAVTAVEPLEAKIKAAGTAVEPLEAKIKAAGRRAAAETQEAYR